MARSRDRSLGERTSLPTGAETGFNCLTLSFLLNTTFSGPVLGWSMSGAVFSGDRSLISRDWFYLEWRSILTTILCFHLVSELKTRHNCLGAEKSGDRFVW